MGRYTLGILLIVLNIIIPVQSYAKEYVQVDGLYGTATRIDRNAPKDSALWIGDKFHGKKRKYIHTSAGAILLLRHGKLSPAGTHFELSEFMLLSITDTEIFIHSGHMRIYAGSENPPVISTPFGTFIPGKISISDILVRGHSIDYKSLKGESRYAPRGKENEIPILPGQQLNGSSRGAYRINAIRSDIRRTLLGKLRFHMSRTSSNGKNTPKLQIMNPKTGFVTSSETIKVTGIVSPVDTKMKVKVMNKFVRVSREGIFTTNAKLPENGLAKIPIFLKYKGDTTEVVIFGVRDIKPPLFDLADLVDPVDPELIVVGRITEPGIVFVNNQLVATRGTRFRSVVPIKPGKNEITLSAIDLAANRSDISINVGYEPQSSGDKKDPYKAAIEKIGNVKIKNISYQNAGIYITYESMADKKSLPDITYQVYRSFSKNSSYSKVGETKETKFIDGIQPEPGVSYFYRIAASDQYGREGAKSDPVTYTIPLTPPGPPNGVTAKYQNGMLRIVWNIPDNPIATGFNVYKIVEGKPERLASVLLPPYVEKLSKADAEKYEFEITTTSTFIQKESKPSARVKVKP